VAGRFRSVEKSNDIRIQTFDLPACSTVPQPTSLPRVPSSVYEKLVTDIIDIGKARPKLCLSMYKPNLYALSGGRERGELPEKLFKNLRLSRSTIFLWRAVYIQNRRT
jgi:hypothetical protein